MASKRIFFWTPHPKGGGEGGGGLKIVSFLTVGCRKLRPVTVSVPYVTWNMGLLIRIYINIVHRSRIGSQLALRDTLGSLIGPLELALA